MSIVVIWAGLSFLFLEYWAAIVLGYSLGAGTHAWWLAAGFLVGRYSASRLDLIVARHLVNHH